MTFKLFCFLAVRVRIYAWIVSNRVLKDIVVCWLYANIFCSPRLNAVGGPLLYSAFLFKFVAVNFQCVCHCFGNRLNYVAYCVIFATLLITTLRSIICMCASDDKCFITRIKSCIIIVRGWQCYCSQIERIVHTFWWYVRRFLWRCYIWGVFLIKSGLQFWCDNDTCEQVHCRMVPVLSSGDILWQHRAEPSNIYVGYLLWWRKCWAQRQIGQTKHTGIYNSIGTDCTVYRNWSILSLLYALWQGVGDTVSGLLVWTSIRKLSYKNTLTCFNADKMDYAQCLKIYKPCIIESVDSISRDGPDITYT